MYILNICSRALSGEEGGCQQPKPLRKKQVLILSFNFLL